MPLASASVKNPGVVPNNLAELFKTSVLTDFTLRVQGRCFAVHKVVLAAGSPYFRALLTTDMSDSRAETLEVPDVSEDVFEAVLSFMYKGEAQLEGFTFATRLLSAADCFMMSDLAHMTLQAIKQHATVEDFPELLVESHRLFIQDLEAFALARCCQHFAALSRTAAFLTLPFDALLQLLQSRFLVIENELAVLDAALSWLEGHRENQSQDRALVAKQIIAYIHFHDVDPAALPRFWPRLACHCSDFDSCRRVLCGLGRAGMMDATVDTSSRWLLQRVETEKDKQELAKQLFEFGTERPERGNLCVELLAMRQDDGIRRRVVNMVQDMFDTEVDSNENRNSPDRSMPRCGELLALADLITNLIGKDMLHPSITTKYVLPKLANLNSDTGWLLLCNIRHGLLRRLEQAEEPSRRFIERIIQELRGRLEEELGSTAFPWLRLELQNAVQELRG
mmetsp:Transcript_116773/g.325387  ORF Transcript_116773/g.325387 Transcript_116773/m.325387 type:complete len:451 (+) Transcript_116773:44-1396(+)|eukprot:CAMPEP_0179069888 /NCGR_PEP_ID=MMETSP0796-20121207/30739_1 /TAXON_ID=73915 /ORGANISM="Pyrodinium bahamense, Strain pbaha01" /LENGTH=450 /DNA_ID=CAMNT_0020766967 /DNA_START=17 /DNA_END=1369 /DNA_ORIENTATION=-